MTTLMEVRPRAAEPTTAAEITAANVRAACGRVGWKQSDLARAIGMSQQAVNVRWTGKRQWQLEDLDVVATALGTTPWALVTPAPGDEWRPARDEAPTRKGEGLEGLPRLDSNQQPFD